MEGLPRTNFLRQQEATPRLRNTHLRRAFVKVHESNCSSNLRQADYIIARFPAAHTVSAFCLMSDEKLASVVM